VTYPRRVPGHILVLAFLPPSIRDRDDLTAWVESAPNQGFGSVAAYGQLQSNISYWGVGR
jgi:hypothetical protein